MNKMKRQIAAIIPLLILTACSAQLSIPTSTSQASSPTLVLNTVVPTATVFTPTLHPASTDEVAGEPTFFSISTVIPEPTITAEPPPAFTDPYIITLRIADLRLGPGIQYDLSHTLSDGTRTTVKGRSEDEQWWAVPGPGDGPGPLSWIQSADAEFFGDINSVPVLSLPSDGRIGVPVYFDPGSPPTNVCTVTPFGNDLEPVYVRLGPGEQFNIIYRLGGWAEVVKTEIGWHMILLGPGETGWVRTTDVETSTSCL